MIYKTEFYIHSKIGVTPITDRGGCYCDLLAQFSIDCESIEEAREIAQQLRCIVKNAKTVHYNLPDHPNHNLNGRTIY